MKTTPFFISKATEHIAWSLASNYSMGIIDFFERSRLNEVVLWTHTRVCFTITSKTFSGHIVETKCNKCGQMPCRNFAGIGSMYLLNTGKKKMKILCRECAKAYPEYIPFMKQRPRQLELF